jgi:hypothetical protein
MRIPLPAAIVAVIATMTLATACASGPAGHAEAAVLRLARAGAGAPSSDPAVFAAGISCPPDGNGATPCTRLAVLSSRTGTIARWLTPPVSQTYDSPVSVRGGWVYFSRTSAGGTKGIWRVPLAGGPAQLVQAGAVEWAMSQDGHVVAYVISSRYREELITRDLVTGRRDTIIIASNPDGNDNNWPPGAGDLSWSPDDAQLALELQPTAAISSVLVLSAFTATTINDATIAPAPCSIAKELWQCTETDPAYLADGALSYAIQRASGQGSTTSLVTWRDGRTTTLHVFTGALSQQYDMTAKGQAIWIGSPSRPGGTWPVWCWSAGSVTKIATLPSADSPSAIAWLSPRTGWLRQPPA